MRSGDVKFPMVLTMREGVRCPNEDRGMTIATSGQTTRSPLAGKATAEGEICAGNACSARDRRRSASCRSVLKRAPVRFRPDLLDECQPGRTVSKSPSADRADIRALRPLQPLTAFLRRSLAEARRQAGGRRTNAPCLRQAAPFSSAMSNVSVQNARLICASPSASVPPARTRRRRCCVSFVCGQSAADRILEGSSSSC